MGMVLSGIFKMKRYKQNDYSTTAHSLDDYYDAGGTNKTIDGASGKLAHEVKRAGRGRSDPKFCLLPKPARRRVKKEKDYTEILSMLPASYADLAARLGVGVDAVERRVYKMRKAGHNLRMVGIRGKYVIEEVGGVVKLPPTKTWREY